MALNGRIQWNKLSRMTSKYRNPKKASASVGVEVRLSIYQIPRGMKRWTDDI